MAALLAAALSGAAAAQAAEPIRIALIEGLSGPFANAGEAVFRNLLWAVERVNAARRRAGCRRRAGRSQLVRFDSKGQTEEALLDAARRTRRGASASSCRATARPSRPR